MSGTEIDIARVRQIAAETRGTIAKLAEDGTKKFENDEVPPAAVGTLPVSREYAAQVAAAHAFFVETIQGVLADLEDFATNLQASADAHETNDGSAAAALNAMDVAYQEHDYHSAAENQTSASNEDLAVSPEAQQAAETTTGGDEVTDEAGSPADTDQTPVEQSQDTSFATASP